MKELLKHIIFDQQGYTYPTDVQREFDESLVISSDIVIISGVRRCGKSVLLQQIRSRLADKDYFMNFDDERLINFKVEDFQLLYETFIELFGEQHTFYFDEIQNISGWERFVRRLYDGGNKVFITGSNATMLSKELGTHLTGRYVRIELYPFSFAEYLKMKKVPVSQKDFYTTVGKVKLSANFKDYLNVGGFPRYVIQPNDNYLSTLYQSIIYRDVLTRNRLTNEKEMLELVYYLASNATKQFTYNSLAKTIGFRHTETIKKYIGYIEDTYLASQLLKFDFSLKVQMAAPKKIYFIDNALIKKIGFNATDNWGQLLENAVFVELSRRGYEVFYHAGKIECDFVARQGVRITKAYQVSVSLQDEKTRKREISGLIDALRTYNLTEGTILTMEENDQLDIDGYSILILPVWKWLLLI